jgi:hypothetical protein
MHFMNRTAGYSVVDRTRNDETVTAVQTTQIITFIPRIQKKLDKAC